jgi:large subunit ribosomal protein L24
MAAVQAKTKMKIKKGDKVVVISGSDRGKTGEVIKVMPAESRVIVEGVNQAKKHRRATPMSAGGIETIAQPIHVSNVAHIDPKTSKPTRIGYQISKDGTKIRVAKKSGEAIDK